MSTGGLNGALLCTVLKIGYGFILYHLYSQNKSGWEESHLLKFIFSHDTGSRPCSIMECQKLEFWPAFEVSVGNVKQCHVCPEHCSIYSVAIPPKGKWCLLFQQDNIHFIIVLLNIHGQNNHQICPHIWDNAWFVQLIYLQLIILLQQVQETWNNVLQDSICHLYNIPMTL